MPAEKRCSACKKVKPADAFPRRPNGALQSWCRECYRAYHRKPGAERVVDRDVKPAKSKPAKSKPAPAKAAAPSAPVTPPPAPRLAERAPEEKPSERLKRLRTNVEARRQTERASRVPLRCKLIGPDGKVCGAVVMSNHATLHAYQQHKKNVPIETIGEYFERAPNGAEAAA